MKKILCVEDDQAILTGLHYTLTQEGYQVLSASTMGQALSHCEKTSFDLALLDVTLPDGSGYDLCKKIKEDSRLLDCPVIFLTACDEEVNVVMGLDLGADDYITKPFRVRELVSRINSVLRRSQRTQDPKAVMRYQDLIINTVAARVFKKEEEVFLTTMEYRLLLVLAVHQNQVLTREQLFEGLWDIAGDFVSDNTLTVYMKRLREKLEEDPAHPTIFKTIRGIGYKMGE